MADVFISYTRKDQEERGRVVPIAEALKAEGYDVFYDVQIPPGSSWDQELQAKIDAARYVIVLWSHQSIDSDWVKEEAEIAKKAGKLIPVFLDRVPAPLGFGRIEGADLSGWDGSRDDVEWRNLVAVLKERSGTGKGGQRSGGRVQGGKKRNRKFRAWIAGAVAVTVLGVAGWLFWLSQSPQGARPSMEGTVLATDLSTVTQEDQPIVVDLFAENKIPPDAPVAVVFPAEPEYGALSEISGGQVTYTPKTDYNGEDAFTYALRFGDTESRATVRITVDAVNDAPHARDFERRVVRGTPVVIDLLSEVNDPDNSPSDLSIRIDSVDGEPLEDPGALFLPARMTSGALRVFPELQDVVSAIPPAKQEGILVYWREPSDFEGLSPGQLLRSEIKYSVSDDKAATSSGSIRIESYDPVVRFAIATVRSKTPARISVLVLRGEEPSRESRESIVGGADIDIGDTGEGEARFGVMTDEPFLSSLDGNTLFIDAESLKCLSIDLVLKLEGGETVNVMTDQPVCTNTKGEAQPHLVLAMALLRLSLDRLAQQLAEHAG